MIRRSLSRLLLPLLSSWSLLAAGAVATAQDPGSQGSTPPRVRGLEVTFETMGAGKGKEPAHCQTARVLSLCVERGETPTPFVPPGAFRATFRALLPLAARDRYQFRAVGRGTLRLSINGESVLSGTLNVNRPLETAQAVRLKKGDNELVAVFDSLPLGEGQFRVSWSGPEFGFEPIAPELFVLPDPVVTLDGSRLRHGQQLFLDHRCARCHEPVQRIGESAFGEFDQPGPDLRAVGARLQTNWIAALLRDPRALVPHARMPRLPFAAPGDVADIAAWLGGLGRPLAAPEFTAEEGSRGQELFEQLGCIACHVMPQEKDSAGIGERSRLDHLRQKWHPAALVAFLQQPSRDYPHIAMPDFGLSRADAQALGAFLWQVVAPPLPEVRGNPEQGRRLAQRYGCIHCHELDVPLDGRRERALQTLNPVRGCLGDDAKAPAFGFGPADIDALRAFLPRAEQVLSRRAPVDYAQRAVAARRCTACHGMDGIASVWATVTNARSAVDPLPVDRDPTAQGVPALTWVGDKLQPSWLEHFVTGRESSPRPWLHARMPAFARDGGVITGGLVREHGHGSADEPAGAVDPSLAVHGQNLVRVGQGFGCVQCHGIGDQPPVQVFERQGINFAVAASRLRKEYYTRWLLDPLRIDADARMPKYADAKGKTAFTEVLGGDAARQFEAIWHYLVTLRR